MAVLISSSDPISSSIPIFSLLQAKNGRIFEANKPILPKCVFWASIYWPAGSWELFAHLALGKSFIAVWELHL